MRFDPINSHEGSHPGDDIEATARSVLLGVLQHVGAELSAHETIIAEQDACGLIAQLAAEYETLAAAHGGDPRLGEILGEDGYRSVSSWSFNGKTDYIQLALITDMLRMFTPNSGTSSPG